MPSFDVEQTLRGRTLLFAGATGFVGKVALSMFLHRYGEAIEKMVVVVRKGSSASAERRFFDKIVTSEPFEPLREKLGDKVDAFYRAKCQVLDGDITDPMLGFTDAEVRSLQESVDVVINCAGLVSFNPSLEVGLNVNTLGVQNVVDLCLKLDVPLVHVSTAFVAGNRNGLVFEDETVEGYFPKHGSIDGRDFSLDQEIADCQKRWRSCASAPMTAP
jgi:long-chain acyl-CoA synthetase